METMEDPHRPLRGEEAGELLRLALRASGLELSAWRRTHLFERPGAEASAIFEVSACQSTGGGSAELHLIASTVDLSAQQRQALGAVRLDPEGSPDAGSTDHPAPVHLWVHPADPELPGLPDACDPGRLAQRISVLRGSPVTAEQLQMLVLRPLRRAVLKATVKSGRTEQPDAQSPAATSAEVDSAETVYVKVLRPERAQHQLIRHHLVPSAPAAEDLGEGILLVEQAAGRPLTEHLHLPGSRPGTDAAALEGLDLAQLTAPLDALQSEDLRDAVVKLPRRRTQAERLEDYAQIALRSGAEPDRVQRLVRRIRDRLLSEPGPVVPTHGDFHPGNIFAEVLPDVGGGPALSPTALIDLDSVGPGYRADDLACLIAHLLTLPTLDPQGYASVSQVTDAVWTQAALRPDCSDLGARVAGVLLSLLPSAHTGVRRSTWLELAEMHVKECD